MSNRIGRLLLPCATLFLCGASTSLADDVKPAVDCRGDALPSGALARLGTVRLRHGGLVQGIVFSPDGKLLFSSGNDSMIRVWDSGTGEERGQLKGRSTFPVVSLHISSDGKTLIAHGVDSTVRFWDVDTKRERHRLPKQNDGVICLTISRDDRLLYTGSSTGVIRQWLAPTGMEMRQLTGHPGPVRGLLLSPDGKQLVSAGPDGSVRVWDVAKDTPIRVLETVSGPKGVTDVALALTPDGSLLATATPNRPIKLWDLATLKELPWSPENQAKGGLLAFSPNGKVLAVAERTLPAIIRLLGVTTGKELRQFDIQHSEVRALTFSPDGKFLAGAGDHSIRIWDVGAGREQYVERGHFGAIHSIHLAQDGKTALSTGNDRTARVWNTVTGKELGRFDARMRLYGGGVLGDGKSFISIGQEAVVQWELADGVGREVRRLPMLKTIALLPKSAPDPRVAMSPDGRWLAAAPPGTRLALWDLTTDGEPRQLSAAGPVAALAFSPDSRSLVSTGVLGPTQIWEASTGKLLRQLAQGGSNILAFSADGMTLATHHYGALRLWEFATGHERTQLTLPIPYAMAFSADGNVLAISDFNGSIRLWDVFADRELGELAGHRGAVKALVFSPDGKQLISGSLDSTVLVWDATAWSKKRHQAAVLLQNEDLELSWRMLADADAGKAYQAITSLVAAPAQTVTMLKERLRPVPEVKPEQMARWIADLDSNSFVTREKAVDELVKREALAESALLKALQPPLTPSPELRRRLEAVLQKLKAPNLETLRSLRAVEVLERVDSTQARQHLAALAGGVSGLRQTEAARTASNRSEKRHR